MDHFSPSYFALLGPLDHVELAEQVIPSSFIRVLKTLSGAGVNYLLGGEMVLTLYGVPGKSAELELLIDHEEANIELFIAVGNKAGFKGLKEEEAVFRSSFPLVRGSGPQLRALLTTSLPYEEFYERRTTIFLKSLVIHLLSLEDMMMVRELMEK